MEPDEVPALLYGEGEKRCMCQLVGSFGRKNKAGQVCGGMEKTPSHAPFDVGVCEC